MLGLGLVAGVLGGLLGIGGGTLVVPGLVFFFAFGQHRAHGTSLVVALMLATSGVLTYALHGEVNAIIALEIAAGGVIGAIFGASAANAIKGRVLRRIFSVFLILVAIRMIYAGLYPNSCSTTPAFANGSLPMAMLVVGVGILTGFMSALLGIGGGVVMVPAMVMLLGIAQKSAHGISLAAMMPTAFTGILMHCARGNVDFRVGGWVGLGAAVGAFCGALAAVNLDACTLRLIFAIFLILMSALMAAKK